MADNTIKVVIVDDEEDVVMYLFDILCDNGYKVWTASDGREGYRIIREMKPDLVCLDILMPVETGFSLYRKIKTDPQTKSIPVIIISGMNYREEMEGKNGAEVSDIPPPEHYMEKPVKPRQFLNVVREVIG